MTNLDDWVALCVDWEYKTTDLQHHIRKDGFGSPWWCIKCGSTWEYILRYKLSGHKCKGLTIPGVNDLGEFTEV